jgi:prepilin-type N-terminal cleavage/methylation domain-containing protein
MHRGSSRPAFTLLELLLVIVIISILMSILLPALMRARQTAYGIQCAARESSLIRGTLMHATDHRESLPFPNWLTATVDETQVGWLYQPPVYDWSPKARQSGSIWRYVDSHDAYRCQSHNTKQTGSANITSFLMNGAVIGYGDHRVTRPFRIDQFLPQAAIFWEAEDLEIVTETGGGERSDGSTWPGANITPRHGNSVNVAVIDGGVINVSMDRFQSEQIRKPGMLWCVPNKYGH